MASPIRQTRGKAAYRRGLWAEWQAKWLLRLKFYRILGQRVQTRAGEVDIVARQGRTLVIVEVKARPTMAEALEAVHPRQQVRLARAAEILLAEYGGRVADMTIRFDIIQVTPRQFPVHLVDAWRP